MNYYNKLLHIKDIFERLQDDISRQIFNTKLDYINNPDGYADAVYGLCNPYFSPQLEHMLKKLGGQPQIIIYGSGDDGKRTRKFLCDMGYIPYAFCETPPRGIKTKLRSLRSTMSIKS